MLNDSNSTDGAFEFTFFNSDTSERPRKAILPERQQPTSTSDSYFVSQEDNTKAQSAPVVHEDSGNDNSTVITRHATVERLDESALNRLKAAYLKAKLRRTPDAGKLEQEYNDALSAAAETSVSTENRIEVLHTMDTRGVNINAAGKPINEMTIADMVAEEKRTRGSFVASEGRLLADGIGKDKKFKNDLDYIDENAEKLAFRIQKSQIDLRNQTIDEVRKLNVILDSCPLCQSEGLPPIAPVVSTGTRIYLSLPTMPQLSPGAATIVPISHKRSTLECDDDEWEEIRNFMKCLVRMYRSQNRGVLFYENAASQNLRHHATIEAVPLPYDLIDTAPAYFREAILSSDEEWSSHQKVINTLDRAIKGGLGKLAFRRSLVKEVPFFHVWFTIDGGFGHVIEDTYLWPKGDLFAREVIGGMLELEPNVIKRQSRWQKGADPRLKGFRQMWDKYDWTAELLDYNTR
ncbi:CwfJ C-terminus 1-domain-containing protein-like protein [Lipomyces japonicus]|uniref:CwfJ C-terminus 1-domain-containing protein-like protein n=1 Tax=Lipomyces japonicus TaxID=56871 RepID=UPI0034CE8642